MMMGASLPGLLAWALMALMAANTHLASANVKNSIPYEEVRIYRSGPAECMYDPLDPALRFQLGPNCDTLVPEASTSCPSIEEGISYQYYVNYLGLPVPFAEWFISSNQTLKPFSADPIPIEDFMPALKKPVMPAVCDKQGRCIEAYELNASIVTADFGFKDEDGKPLLTQVMTYDGTFPGPRFEVTQGTQTLVRLHNNIHCDPETQQPYPNEVIEKSYFAEVTGLTMHLHGSSSLSPFDGWTYDFIRPCGFKDYVYPNERPAEPLWYHDHVIGATATTAGMGLAGTYFIRGCDQSCPPQLDQLGTPQYLVLTDQLFIQEEGSSYINPGIKNRTANTFYFNKSDGTQGRLPLNTGSGGWEGGDHNLVNGKPWPVVTVERKPYYFIFLNAAVSRVFNLNLKRNGSSMNAKQGVFWVVGSDGGLRQTPVSAPNGLTISTGERYQVVIDFSSFKPGDELILYNEPSPWSEVPTYCFSHLVMKFIVSGAQAAQPAFNPMYSQSDDRVIEQGELSMQEMRSACAAALAEPTRADIQIATPFNSQLDNVKGVADQSAMGIFTINPVSKLINKQSNASEDWRINLMGMPGDAQNDDGHHDHDQRRANSRHLRAGGLGRKLKQEVNITGGVLPQSMATNGWTTWWIYNPYSAVHPIHIHLSGFFACGRKPVSPEQCPESLGCPSPSQVGLNDYEMFVNKDVIVMPAFTQIFFVARIGPHQGKFQFHCHNLLHEDEGLMGTFNSTSANPANALTSGAVFAPGAGKADRYAGGWARTPISPLLFEGEDPLVKQAADSYVGKNLAYADSMPPWAMKTTADGRPQPITKQLLAAVLKRGYYKVFYPDGRAGLTVPVKMNNWAVVCSK